MTGDDRLMRRAVIASVALHLAVAAVPGAWWGSLARVTTLPPARGASVEVTLWSGPVGEDLPTLEPPVEAPTPSSSAPPRREEAPPPSPAAAEAPTRTAPPDLEGLIGTGTGSAPRPRPRGAGAPAAGDGDNPYVPPRLLAGALPIDPRESEALNVPSEIPVRLRVGVDGRVRDVVPEIDDLPPAVVAALRRSAATMRFTPARRGDRPVEAWFPMTFVYRR